MGDEALRVARGMATNMDPESAACAAGVRFEGSAEKGTFEVPFLGDVVALTFPGFEVEGDSTIPPHILALLIYYLLGSDGTEPRGEWTSFGDLPDGGFYVQAFRGYTASAIARDFGNDVERLGEALGRLGARPLDDLAERAWLVPALPLVPIAVLWWHGDEEFEPRTDVLFDVTAPGHLPTDGLAVLGGWLTKLLTEQPETVTD